MVDDSAIAEREDQRVVFEAAGLVAGARRLAEDDARALADDDERARRRESGAAELADKRDRLVDRDAWRDRDDDAVRHQRGVERKSCVLHPRRESFERRLVGTRENVAQGLDGNPGRRRIGARRRRLAPFEFAPDHEIGGVCARLRRRLRLQGVKVAQRAAQIGVVPAFDPPARQPLPRKRPPALRAQILCGVVLPALVNRRERGFRRRCFIAHHAASPI